jgi:phosphotransferase system HPr (HPr) family protein
MLERPVGIRNALGLHARAAAQLVRLANGFRCTISLRRHDNGLTANAKSILSVLHLAAACGTELSIIADGEDEIDAIEAIERLVLDGFGEM